MHCSHWKSSICTKTYFASHTGGYLLSVTQVIAFEPQKKRASPRPMWPISACLQAYNLCFAGQFFYKLPHAGVPRKAIYLVGCCNFKCLACQHHCDYMKETKNCEFNVFSDLGQSTEVLLDAELLQANGRKLKLAPNIRPGSCTLQKLGIDR